MSFLVSKLRNGNAPEATPVINIENGGEAANGRKTSPPVSGGRFSRSKSPNGRARSSSRAQSFPSAPPSFPTPFHAFKLHPVGNKNQVNALKFIDRIDSLLFLGHSGATVLAAVPPCMANSEAQAWYNRIMASDLLRPATIEEFRQLLITDHIWAFEQTRINSRYQTRSAANANRKDPYLDSAEFKLHLSYIRDIVRLEEAQSRDEKKIQQLELEKSELAEREGTLQMAVATLQNETVARSGGQPVPVLQRTNDILSNMKQLDDAKLKVSMLEQEKRALNEKVTALQMKVDDMDGTNNQLSGIRLQLQNSNNNNAELQNIILQLEASNAQLQNKLLAAQTSPSSSPPPGGADSREVQRLRRQNQQILDELHQKEIRVHDLEAQVRSYSFLQSQQNDQHHQPQQADRSAIGNLEEIIKQKDNTISNLHGNLNKLTDESIIRIQRVYQIEQLLLDSQLAARNRDAQIFTLERKLQNLGHAKDCNCNNCSLLTHRNTSPDFRRTTSPDLNKPSARVMSIGSASDLTAVSRSGTPSQPYTRSLVSPPRFLDIKFKFRELYPSFIPATVAQRTAQLLQNGLTIAHPGQEFTLLWENIAKALLETLGGEAQTLGELTRHMKLCYRERVGETLAGLVIATSWPEAANSVSGLDVVCDF